MMSKAHWLALGQIPGIGGVTLRRLLERFGSVEAVLAAPAEELRRVPRVTGPMIDRLRDVSLEALEAELAELGRQGFQVLTCQEAAYPDNLRTVADAPPVLFVRGSLSPVDSRAVAIVGTRQPSPEKEAFARDLARELGRRGLTIVSGLALGIDTAAHQGALQTANGRTLAVPGSGLLALHPRANLSLAEAIIPRGALLSELSPRTVARGSILMARNRIVSGLSRAVIVVEAGIRSGSLDTAARARRQGRPLLTVAGSPGTDALLGRGAVPLCPQAADWDPLYQQVEAAIQVA